MPVDKTARSMVFAGTVNGEGLLTVEIAKSAKDRSWWALASTMRRRWLAPALVLR